MGGWEENLQPLNRNDIINLIRQNRHPKQQEEELRDPYRSQDVAVPRHVNGVDVVGVVGHDDPWCWRRNGRVERHYALV